MTIVNTPNLGLPYAVPGSQEPADIFAVWNAAAIALDAHSHAAGSGSAIGRLQTGALPAASGEVQIDTSLGLFKFHDGAGVRTLVDTATPQTLANKTLTGAILSDFANMQHDHQDADDGGTLDGAAIATGVSGSGAVLKASAPVMQAPVVSAGGMGITGTLSVAGSIGASGNFDASTYYDVPVVTTPASPLSSRIRLYAKSDGQLYKLLSTGAEAAVGGAIARSIPAEALSPAGGCDPVFRSSGTTRYELAYVHTEDGHAVVNLTIPQNYPGGVIRFRVYVWTTATAQTVWRLLGVAIGDGASQDTGWASLGDTTVVHVANQLKAFTVNWTVAASEAGKVLTVGLQRLANSNGSDTYNDVAYFRAMDVLFGA